MRTDPTILAFLSFLEQDIELHPERLRIMSPDMVRRMNDLTNDVVFDPDEPIEGDVDF